MLGRFFCGTNISENLHFSRLKGVRWIYEIENGLDEGWSVRKPKNEWLEGPSVDILLYCTISIDSAVTRHKARGHGRIPSPVPSHSPPGWRPLVNQKNGLFKTYLRLWVMFNVLYFNSRWLTGQWEIYLGCRKSQGKVSWYLILVTEIWGNWLDAVSIWIQFIVSPEILGVVKAFGGFWQNCKLEWSVSKFVSPMTGPRPAEF